MGSDLEERPLSETSATQIIIRPARPADAGVFLQLVQAFADFEGLPAPSREAKTRLIDHLFRDRPAYRLLVSEADGQVVGYAAHCLMYSTFLARPTFFLEDIFGVQTLFIPDVLLGLFGLLV